MSRFLQSAVFPLRRLVPEPIPTILFYIRSVYANTKMFELGHTLISTPRSRIGLAILQRTSSMSHPKWTLHQLVVPHWRTWTRSTPACIWLQTTTFRTIQRGCSLLITHQHLQATQLHRRQSLWLRKAMELWTSFIFTSIPTILVQSMLLSSCSDPFLKFPLIWLFCFISNINTDLHL